MDVIFCDDRLADGTWKDVLSTIAPMADAPRLIVVSDGAPAALCSEVMNLGGFDVLSKPMQDRDISRAVAASCRSFEYGKKAPANSKEPGIAIPKRMAATG